MPTLTKAYFRAMGKLGKKKQIANNSSAALGRWGRAGSEKQWAGHVPKKLSKWPCPCMMCCKRRDKLKREKRRP